MKKLTLLFAALLISTPVFAGCNWVWHEYTNNSNGYWEYVCTLDYDTELTTEPDWGLYPHGATVWINTAIVDGLPIPTSWYVSESYIDAPSCCPYGPYTVFDGTLAPAAPCYYTIGSSHTVTLSDGSFIVRTVFYCTHDHSINSCGRAMHCPNGFEMCDALNRPEVLPCN